MGRTYPDKCIILAWKCDGEMDCEDRSDEADCITTTRTTTRLTTTSTASTTNSDDGGEARFYPGCVAEDMITFSEPKRGRIVPEKTLVTGRGFTNELCAEACRINDACVLYGHREDNGACQLSKIDDVHATTNTEQLFQTYYKQKWVSWDCSGLPDATTTTVTTTTTATTAKPLECPNEPLMHFEHIVQKQRPANRLAILEFVDSLMSHDTMFCAEECLDIGDFCHGFDFVEVTQKCRLMLLIVETQARMAEPAQCNGGPLYHFREPVPNVRGRSQTIIGRYQGTATSDVCATKCLTRPDCRTFARSGLSGRCLLYSSNTSTVVLTPLSDMQHHYTRLEACRQSSVRDVSDETSPPADTTATTIVTTTSTSSPAAGLYTRTKFCLRAEFIHMESEQGSLKLQLTPAQQFLKFRATVHLQPGREDAQLYVRFEHNGTFYAGATIVIDSGRTVMDVILPLPRSGIPTQNGYSLVLYTTSPWKLFGHYARLVVPGIDIAETSTTSSVSSSTTTSRSTATSTSTYSAVTSVTSSSTAVSTSSATTTITTTRTVTTTGTTITATTSTPNCYGFVENPDWCQPRMIPSCGVFPELRTNCPLMCGVCTSTTTTATTTTLTTTTPYCVDDRKCGRTYEPSMCDPESNFASVVKQVHKLCPNMCQVCTTTTTTTTATTLMFDCEYTYSVCTAQCEKGVNRAIVISRKATGAGSLCPGQSDVPDCQPGDGLCPTTTTTTATTTTATTSTYNLQACNGVVEDVLCGNVHAVDVCAEEGRRGIIVRTACPVMCGVCTSTTTATTTTTSITSTTTTLTITSTMTTTTLMLDCEYTYSACTVQCEQGLTRAIVISRKATGAGSLCPGQSDVPDCQPGDGLCPTTTMTTTTTFTTPVSTTTTTTTTTTGITTTTTMATTSVSRTTSTASSSSSSSKTNIECHSDSLDHFKIKPNFIETMESMEVAPSLMSRTAGACAEECLDIGSECHGFEYTADSSSCHLFLEMELRAEMRQSGPPQELLCDGGNLAQFDLPIADHRGSNLHMITAIAVTRHDTNCASKCLANPECQSFTRAQKNGRCRLYSSNSDQLVKTPASSLQWHYERLANCTLIATPANRATKGKITPANRVTQITGASTTTTTTTSITTTTTVTSIIITPRTGAVDRSFVSGIYERHLFCERADAIVVESFPVDLPAATVLQFSAMVDVRADTENAIFLTKVQRGGLTYATKETVLDAGRNQLDVTIGFDTELPVGSDYTCILYITYEIGGGNRKTTAIELTQFNVVEGVTSSSSTGNMLSSSAAAATTSVTLTTVSDVSLVSREPATAPDECPAAPARHFESSTQNFLARPSSAGSVLVDSLMSFNTRSCAGECLNIGPTCLGFAFLSAHTLCRHSLEVGVGSGAQGRLVELPECTSGPLFHFQSPIRNQRGLYARLIKTTEATQSDTICANSCLALGICLSFTRSALSGRCRLYNVAGDTAPTPSGAQQRHFRRLESCRAALSTSSSAPPTTVATAAPIVPPAGTNETYRRVLFCPRNETIVVESLKVINCSGTTFLEVRARVLLRATREFARLRVQITAGGIEHGSTSIVLDGGLNAIHTNVTLLSGLPTRNDYNVTLSASSSSWAGSDTLQKDVAHVDVIHVAVVAATGSFPPTNLAAALTNSSNTLSGNEGNINTSTNTRTSTDAASSQETDTPTASIGAIKLANIFVFVADGLSRDDLGHYGNQFVATPHVDTFAANSVEFSQMYTASAICAPSRAALYTGLYPIKASQYLVTGGSDGGIMRVDKAMRDRGYDFGLFGDGGVGIAPMYDDLTTLGGMTDLNKFQMYTSNLRLAAPPQCLLYASDEPRAPHFIGQGSVSVDETPLPPKWPEAKEARLTQAGYYTDVNLMDAEFGLFELAVKDQPQFTNNSIVVFTSSHGNGFFAESSLYDAGLKVPFFLQHLGGGFTSKRIKQLTSFVDILPTFIDIAGAPPVETLDGKSMLPLLQRDSPFRFHKYVFGVHTNQGVLNGNPYPIRSVSNGQWKLIINPNSKFQQSTAWLKTRWFKDWVHHQHAQANRSDWAHFFVCRPSEELYNLEQDPHEERNLADKELYAPVKSLMQGTLAEWMESQGDADPKMTELEAARHTSDQGSPIVANLCSDMSTTVPTATVATARSITTSSHPCGGYGRCVNGDTVDLDTMDSQGQDANASLTSPILIGVAVAGIGAILLVLFCCGCGRKKKELDKNAKFEKYVTTWLPFLKMPAKNLDLRYIFAREHRVCWVHTKSRIQNNVMLKPFYE